MGSLAAVVTLIICSPAVADFLSAQTAYAKGDFGLAFSDASSDGIWRPSKIPRPLSGSRPGTVTCCYCEL